MPAWAEEEPGHSGRLRTSMNARMDGCFVSADFALPRDLDHETQIALAKQLRPRVDR